MCVASWVWRHAQSHGKALSIQSFAQLPTIPLIHASLLGVFCAAPCSLAARPTPHWPQCKSFTTLPCFTTHVQLNSETGCTMANGNDNGMMNFAATRVAHTHPNNTHNTHNTHDTRNTHITYCTHLPIATTHATLRTASQALLAGRAAGMGSEEQHGSGTCASGGWKACINWQMAVSIGGQHSQVLIRVTPDGDHTHLGASRLREVEPAS